MDNNRGNIKNIIVWILLVIGTLAALTALIYGGVIALECWLFVNDKMFGGFFLLYAALGTGAALAGAVLGFFCIRAMVRRLRTDSRVTIRRVQEGDEGILAYIQTESWKAAFANIVEPEKLARCTQIDRAKEMYRGLLEENKGNGYILAINGIPHCIAYWDATRESDMPGCAELICIHSLPNNWHRGYGSKMMDAVIRDVRAAGYTRIMLWVFEDNKPAISFYEKYGFEATGRRQPALGATEVMYEKAL